jgi:hypothetical protein
MVSDLSKDGQAIEYKWKLFCIVELACTTGKLFLGRVLLKYLVLAYGVQPRSRPIGIVRTGQEKMDKDLVELWLFADRSTGLWAAHDQRGYVFWLSECVNSTPYEVCGLYGVTGVLAKNSDVRFVEYSTANLPIADRQASGELGTDSSNPK